MNAHPVSPWSRRDVQIGAVIAVALAIAFIVWLIVRGGGGSSGTNTTTTSPLAAAPHAATVSQLRALAVRAGHPIYWAGPQAGRVYELSVTSSGRFYVRYLPHGVSIGNKGAYTFVGTYPFANAYQALKSLAKHGDTSFTVPGNGLAVYSNSQPTNVYVAFPGTTEEIEVFDPSPAHARALIASGQIQPVR
ncbi:MAG: hypothetical protein ACXVQ4_07900 [Gaiellaceae bacterium]